MKKLLFSWIAFNNDFKDGKVDKENSPNYQYHHKFYNHDIHYILSSAESDDTRAHHLKSAITNDFNNHNIEIVYMGISNVISLPEIKTKIEKLLLEHRNEDIDIFFSPGTSIMQLSWFICHTTLGLKTKLFQTKPGIFSKSGDPELSEIKIGQSEIPVSTTIKDIVASERDKGQVDDYLITDGIGDIYEKADLIAQTDNVSVLIYGKVEQARNIWPDISMINPSEKKILSFLLIVQLFKIRYWSPDFLGIRKVRLPVQKKIRLVYLKKQIMVRSFLMR